jgi:two-component system response regulator DevR
MRTDSPRTIHLVDDSEAIRERLKELLLSCTCAAVRGEAGTVAEAVRQIKTAKPDFVVLDYQLPDGNGLDVLRQTRAEAPQTCFIVLTNHATPQLQQAFAQAGARMVLDKSNEFQRLAEVISDLSGR